MIINISGIIVKEGELGIRKSVLSRGGDGISYPSRSGYSGLSSHLPVGTGGSLTVRLLTSTIVDVPNR